DAPPIRRRCALRSRRRPLRPHRMGQADEGDVHPSVGEERAQEGFLSPRRLLEGSRHNAERLAGMDQRATMILWPSVATNSAPLSICFQILSKRTLLLIVWRRKLSRAASCFLT